MDKQREQQRNQFIEHIRNDNFSSYKRAKVMIDLSGIKFFNEFSQKVYYVSKDQEVVEIAELSVKIEDIEKYVDCTVNEAISIQQYVKYLVMESVDQLFEKAFRNEM
jgi:hypothetical protein